MNAQEGDIFDLDIAQLSKLKVNIGSKTKETRATVPSTITIFEQADISRLGLDNVYNLLNFVPGFQMTRGDWVGAVPKEHARGVYLDNGYILVMINGQRLNEVSFGKASVYTPYIPTEVVERVEIIRGPGSALYGGNAFLGVLNVVTKKSGNEVTVSIGENNLQRLSGHWSTRLFESSSIYSNLSFEKSDGTHYISSLGRQVSDPHRNVFFEMGTISQQLKTNFRINRNNLDQFINLGGYSLENIHQSTTKALSAELEVYSSLEHLISASANYTDFEIASSGLVLPKEFGINLVDFFVGPYWKTHTIGVKLDHSWIYSDHFTINSGFEYSHQKQYQAGAATNFYDDTAQLIIPEMGNYLGGIKLLTNIPEFSGLIKGRSIMSGFSQVKWLINSQLSTFIGARYDDVHGIDSKLSPRFALVWQANEKNSLKFQYGESFRAPVNNELYSNDDVTTGNSKLTSEFVKTTELVWLHHQNNLSSEVVLFNNQLRDFINKVPYQGEALFTFKNDIDKNMNGVEISLKANMGNHFRTTFNYTNLFDRPINESFKKFANLSLDYSSETWQSSFNLLWRDRVEGILEHNKRFNQSSYVLVGAKISYKISDNEQLSFKVENLTNKSFEVFDPRVSSGCVPGKRRQATLSYIYSFD